MFSAAPFSAIPPAASLSHPTLLAASLGEYGWAAWTYSKTAKLNAWAWHGLGETGTANISAWAQLGSSMYLRRDGDEAIYTMAPDVYLLADDTNDESQSVYAETQWLDFGKPGDLKSLTGIDFDGIAITSVEIYVSIDGDRAGTLAETVLVGSAQDGWTYSGGVLPVNVAGTEFKLRFIADPNLDASVNRLTLVWDSLGAS